MAVRFKPSAALGQRFFGLHKTTLIDFPGEVAATLFIPGCNLTCPYCHNPELVRPGPSREGLFSWAEIQGFLEKRKGVLSGVCLTGGEPLLCSQLPEIFNFIRSCGFRIKLDTNGTLPEVLAELTPDYIAMDIKTAPTAYRRVGGAAGVEGLITKSINWIIQSGIPHEFRTTIVPEITTLEDMQVISQLLRGANKYVLAQFRGGLTLDPDFTEKLPYPIETLEEMQKVVRQAGIPCEIRRGY